MLEEKHHVTKDGWIILTNTLILRIPSHNIHIFTRDLSANHMLDLLAILIVLICIMTELADNKSGVLPNAALSHSKVGASNAWSNYSKVGVSNAWSNLFLEKEIEKMPDDVLIAFKNANAHNLQILNSGKTLDNLGLTALYVEQADYALAAQKEVVGGFLPMWAVYIGSLIVPTVVGCLTAATLKNSSALTRVLSGSATGAGSF
jgi:hypothetical protein